MSKTIFHALPRTFTSPAVLTGLPENTPILVAYSGGADSSALLHMMLEYGKHTGAPICAAHVNHGIRGKEADRDEQFCMDTARTLGVELLVCRADVPAEAKKSGDSIETAARRVRYDFFERIMEERKIPLLVTAHNADDNLETILHHLIRGSGLGGICGIPPCRACGTGTLVRPILGMTREEILAYCEHHSLSFVTDSTNIDTDYTRNKLRANVVPALREINPAAVKNAATLTTNLRADSLCLERMTDLFLEDFRDGFSVDTEKLYTSPDAIANRALRRLFSELTEGAVLESSHVEALRGLAKRGVPHSRVCLPCRCEGVIEEGRLILRHAEKISATEPYRVALKSGSNLISQTNFEIVIGSSQSEKNVYKKSILLSLDSATINGTLIARSRVAGDRIRMGGMHKSLKKLMCDKKIPQFLRSRLPVICDEDGIVAVPMIGTRDGVACSPEDAGACCLHFYLY